MNQEQFAAMVARIEKIYEEASKEAARLNAPYLEEEDYDEEFEDTLDRKYFDGASDYVAIILGILRGKDQI
jgi:hypothetical protein